jgi:hypothetical protein
MSALHAVYNDPRSRPLVSCFTEPMKGFRFATLECSGFIGVHTFPSLILVIRFIQRHFCLLSVRTISYNHRKCRIPAVYDNHWALETADITSCPVLGPLRHQPVDLYTVVNLPGKRCSEVLRLMGQSDFRKEILEWCLIKTIIPLFLVQVTIRYCLLLRIDMQPSCPTNSKESDVLKKKCVARIIFTAL